MNNPVSIETGSPSKWRIGPLEDHFSYSCTHTGHPMDERPLSEQLLDTSPIIMPAIFHREKGELRTASW